MNRDKVMELVCDIAFRTLVREEKSLHSYITLTNAKTIQEAIELIQFLDAQQTVYCTKLIEKNYQSTLQKILFNA